MQFSAFANNTVQQNVGIHELQETRFCQILRWRHPKSTNFKGQICPSYGIPQERLHQWKTTLRYYESGQEPGCEGFRRRNTIRIAIKVIIFRKKARSVQMCLLNNILRVYILRFWYFMSYVGRFRVGPRPNWHYILAKNCKSVWYIICSFAFLCFFFYFNVVFKNY